MHARCGAWPKRYPIPGYRTRPPCVPGPALTSELRRPVPDLAACRVGNLSLSQVDCAQGFYPLCPYCEHNGDCPRFPTGLEMPQWGPPLCSLILRANNNTKAGLKPRFFIWPCVPTRAQISANRAARLFLSHPLKGLAPVFGVDPYRAGKMQKNEKSLRDFSQRLTFFWLPETDLNRQPSD